MEKPALPSFEALKPLVREYKDESAKNSIEIELGLLGEVEKRLEYADTLLHMVEERLDSHFEKMNAAIAGKSFDVQRELLRGFLIDPEYTQPVSECEVLAEAFYHNGWRITSILRSKKYPMPHLSSYDPSGIHRVRNWLLEHPDRYAGKIFNMGSGMSPATGPTIKGGRSPEQAGTFQDPGLYANAIEMAKCLQTKFESAIAAMKGDAPALTEPQPKPLPD